MMNFNNVDSAKGAQEIAEKLRALTFQTISHSISTMDIQPTYDNCILIVVTGALKVSRTGNRCTYVCVCVCVCVCVRFCVTTHTFNCLVSHSIRQITIHQCSSLKRFSYVSLIIHGLLSTTFSDLFLSVKPRTSTDHGFF
jgi:hypothetical protein